jgi:hypothetical protein
MAMIGQPQSENRIPAVVPATAPNSRPSSFSEDSSLTTSEAVAVKRVLAVEFVAGATVAEKQAAIDSVRGSVIGGAPWITAPDQGTYFVLVPNATTVSSLEAAIAVLERQAKVRSAHLLLKVVPQGRRPDAALMWKRADWPSILIGATAGTG